MNNVDDMPVTGNWIDWILYSKESLNKEEQRQAALRKIAENIKKMLAASKKEDVLCLMDIHLYPDSQNDQLYKLVANIGHMPVSNSSDAPDAIKHRHDFYASGGEASLAVSGVHPTPPKGIALENTPFTSPFAELGEATSGHLMFYI